MTFPRRAACCVVAACLVSALCARWAAAADPHAQQTTYFAVFLADKKIGHAVSRRQETKDRVLTSISMSISVPRQGVSMSVQASEQFEETPSGIASALMRPPSINPALQSTNVTDACLAA